ncbi:ABC-type multidrug transport system fused ATPase/permease subunit [Methanocalculus sp. AMF5]|uniref:ABC transporter ATP-binding protein n=1 Tax=Methanocalculus sp. AMF5 TaxID=1198257 RepID=UPI0020A0F572|nr:ABC transporter ATP-binding protein [Methanocalculus sp. AMF5]MCP1663260.1 ABC-type multidrug transport system fused ATPase/permease subunit [Methanocalculus sp. AMF5]
MRNGFVARLQRSVARYRRTYTILEFYSRGFKRHLLALLVFSMLLGLMETFQIVLLYPILNASFNIQEAGIPFIEPLYSIVRSYSSLPEIVTFCLLFIGFVFLTFVVTILYKLISLLFTKAVIVKTKGSIFDKLKESDYRYFVDNKQGDVLYNVITSPQKIKEFLEHSTKIFSDVVVVLVILTTLFFMSPVAMGILLVGGIVFVIVVRFVGNRVAYVIGKVQMASVSSENAVITQYVSGLRQIRSVHADGHWKKEYVKALRHYWDKFVRFRFTESIPAMLLQTIFFSAIAGIVIVLYYIHTDQFMYIVPLIGTFAFSALKILPRLSEIGNLNMKMMDAYANLERIHDFLNDSQYNTIQNGAVPFEELTSDIVFEDVGFQYYEGQDLITDINLKIHKNQVTALVGHSGSGKSTIVSLLLRYYDVTEGRITINGIDLREYDIATFLSKVGYVSQDTFIFNASVRENIAFGGDYTDDQIIEAARKANIHTFIAALPDGYDSIVGDQGLKLSGGEKQRIAIARALVREPEILVLDEATSNLDNESEAIVQASINQISETITTFIIAHRLSTIRQADTIYVMSKGRIVESGGHEELLEMKGKYWELYESGV